jgi:hypothetical protein
MASSEDIALDGAVDYGIAHGSIVLGDRPVNKIAPQWSVRKTLALTCCHASIVTGAGWPKVLCLPTEITAIFGWTAATNAGVDA